jgi:hypothetical protein
MNYLSKYIFPLSLFLLCFAFPGNAQSKKDWGTASGLTFGSNMVVWGFSRYITQSDFAYIGLHTVKENFKKGFVWDNDQVGTNMFGHPYHGSLYFNAARANGFSFWESGAFGLAGSLMWEMLMEN